MRAYCSCVGSYKGHVAPVKRHVRAAAINGPSTGRTFQGRDKAVQVVLETGIRGCLALAVAHALHLDLEGSMSASWQDVISSLPAAAPLVALDVAVAAMATRPKPTTASSSTAAAVNAEASAADFTTVPVHAEQQAQGSLALNCIRQAAQQVQQHMMRFSPATSLPPSQQLLLEVGAQASEELLARGVLLGAATVWLTNRLQEADFPDTLALGSSLTVPLSTVSATVAAAAICTAIASRYAHHAKQQAASIQERHAAAASAAMQQARLLRLNPSGYAAAPHGPASDAGATFIPGPSMNEEQQVALLVHTLLGVRFVGAQAACYGTFIATGSLLASLVVGLLMQASSTITLGFGKDQEGEQP